MNRLSETRARLGLSQNELADELGVSRSQVTRMENGTQGIRAPILKLLDMLDARGPVVAPPPHADTGAGGAAVSQDQQRAAENAELAR